VIDADDRELEVSLQHSGPAPQIAEIQPSQWTKFIEWKGSPRSEEDGIIGEIAKGLSSEVHDVEDARHVRDVLVDNAVPLTDANALAIATVLIPRSALSTKAVQDVLETSSAKILGWRAIQAAADSLRC